MRKEVTRYVETMPGCCVIRVIGDDDGDEPEDYRMRFLEIDLLSTHEPWRMSWKKRLVACWDALRHGRNVDRYFITFYSANEADAFITATIEATRVAFYSEPDKPPMTVADLLARTVHDAA